MTFIKIFKVGDPDNTSTFVLLPEGEHTIGREFFQVGSFLNEIVQTKYSMKKIKNKNSREK